MLLVVSSLCFAPATIRGSPTRWGDFAKSDWSTSEDGLVSVRLSSSMRSYAQMKPFLLTAELRNNSDKSLTLLRPFGDPFYASARGIEMTGPRGRVEYVGEMRRYALGTGAFVRLLPGRTVREKIALAVLNHDSIFAAGTYTICYRYRSPEYPGRTAVPPDHWKGSVTTRNLAVARRASRRSGAIATLLRRSGPHDSLLLAIRAWRDAQNIDALLWLKEHYLWKGKSVSTARHLLGEPLSKERHDNGEESWLYFEADASGKRHKSYVLVIDATSRIVRWDVMETERPH